MKANLIIAIDVGASLTKCIYGYFIEGTTIRREGTKTAYPVARRLIRAKYESSQYLADNNTALVSFEDSYWLVGLAAKESTLTLNPNQAKYQSAIAKSLAMVGQLMAEIRGLGAEEVYVTLGILLPLDESGDCEELQTRLQAALWEFEHNGITVKCIASERVHVSPEGYGISQLATKPLAGVLIFGHRDVSWLHIEDGSIVPGKSMTFAGWGMHRLIKRADFTFKDELRAAHLIFAAEPTLKDDKPLLKLCDPPELPRLKEAIAQARDQLWMDLSIQLRACSLMEIEQVLPSGGNAHYWRLHLKQMLGSRMHLSKAMFLELQNRFQELSGSPLLWRIADVYAFWRTLPNAPGFDQGG